MGIRGTHSNLKDKENKYKFPSTLTKLIWDMQSGLRLDTLLHKSGTMNPNILVNANFKNPVIINGVGSTNVSDKQPIDKWVLNNQSDTKGSVTVNKNFLTLESKSGNTKRTILVQSVDSPNAYNNETITVSMKYRATGNDVDTSIASFMLVNGVGKSNNLGSLICDGKWHIFEATYKISELQEITYLEPIIISIGNNTRYIVQNPNAYGWGTFVDTDSTLTVSSDTKIDIQWVKAELAESATPFKPRLYQEEYSMIYTNQYIRNLLGTTDISAIGGTVTNALSVLNTNKVAKTQFSNPNLLDNPWFTVNQRGQSEYSNSSSNFYALDRWIFTSNLTVTVNDDGTITVTNSSSNATWFSERVPMKELGLKGGETVTQSIMLSDGTILSNTCQFPTTVTSNDKIVDEKGIKTIRVQRLNGDIYHCVFYIMPNESATIRAIKVERGSVSTLAMDTAPNYQQELAKCQRYYQRITASGKGYLTTLSYGKTSNIIEIGINLPVKMYKNPSVSVNGDIGYLPTISGNVSSMVVFSSFNTSFVGADEKQMVYIRFNTADTVELSKNYLVVMAQSSYIEFSSDL